MKTCKILFLILIVCGLCSSCEYILEPENENLSSDERFYKDPGFAEGLLITAYLRLPNDSMSFNEVGTDNAVTNDFYDAYGNYQRMATGQWSASNNPVGLWNRCLSAIAYLEKFETTIDSVVWKWTDDEINMLYNRRFRGETYALKGVFKYYLLVTAGGYNTTNDKLGFPDYRNAGAGDFNRPRMSFDESVKSIYADFDEALKYLPLDYLSVTKNANLPAGFAGVDYQNYNIVFGTGISQRISGRIVKAMKARVALLEASPAFNDNQVLWEKAANYAGELLAEKGGTSWLDPNGHIFYTAARVDATTVASDQKDIIWRTAKVVSNDKEIDIYPPSMFGKGKVNPTQNLVDAFPALNGYPVGHPSSNYNAAKPYANRDPRLDLYIVYHGNKLNNKVISTGVGGGVNAKDSLATSTRTGYYLKKMIREDVNLDPVSTTTKNHYEARMRYTELFLIYAEAANEAWGPDGQGTFGFSARDVIAAIRKRAKITSPDAYLASISTKEEMRDLIRNERRIELCFEGFRFWDMRRWKLDLTETAKGININKTSFQVVDVEPRLYDNNYMHYGPIPYNELIKFSNLVQNKGWDNQ